MTDNDSPEKTQRTKYIDTNELPLPTRGWQTRHGLAARARETAVRQSTVYTTMTRYEERKLLRTELEHAAHDRYYMIVDLAAELELDYTPPRPGTDETLGEYIEARDTFLEMLVNELAMRRNQIKGTELVNATLDFQKSVDTWITCGVQIETPALEAPTEFVDIVGWHNTWRQAYELAQIEYRGIQQKRTEEWDLAHALLRRLQQPGSSYDAPELRQEFETFVTHGVLTRDDLHLIEDQLRFVEYRYRGLQTEKAREQEKKRKRVEEYERALEASRRREIAFREEHPPLITALRLIAEEEAYERRFSKHNERTGKEKLYSTYLPPRRFKRYEERMERLATKITSAHQGVYKILCKKIKWKHMKSGHTGAQADPRRDWRREQRKLDRR